MTDSLQHLGITFCGGDEDAVEYSYENFDLSSLPRGLHSLKLAGLSQWDANKMIKFIGAPPPSLHTVLTDNEKAFDRNLFPPSSKFG